MEYSARAPSTLIAAASSDPYLVYTAYGSDLYRSTDGGRSWLRVASFAEISSVFVSPVSSSTVYVGALQSVTSSTYM